MCIYRVLYRLTGFSKDEFERFLVNARVGRLVHRQRAKTTGRSRLSRLRLVVVLDAEVSRWAAL